MTWVAEPTPARRVTRSGAGGAGGAGRAAVVAGTGVVVFTGAGAGTVVATVVGTVVTGGATVVEVVLVVTGDAWAETRWRAPTPPGVPQEARSTASPATSPTTDTTLPRLRCASMPGPGRHLIVV